MTTETIRETLQREIGTLQKKPIPKRSRKKIKTLARAKLSEMTLPEKIGQLFQLVPPMAAAEGLLCKDGNDAAELIKQGKVGSILSVWDPVWIYQLQKQAVEETRLGIPLFFGVDVIHGCRTGFPINLALACSFSPDLIEAVSRVAAREASKMGITMTYSPMVDLVRDPRWGRVMESSGEDPFLGSVLAKAYVNGYQQGDLSSHDSVAACGKHFAAYGAVEAGREYNTVDMSDRHLRQFYLPAFKACVDADVAALMSAFTVVNGVPATVNRYLLREILRDEWNYDGFVISDFTSAIETTDHKTCRDPRDVAYRSLVAGLDHEMVSDTYIKHLEGLVAEGRIKERLIDEAALRILEFKYKTGLFDDPYKNIYADHETFVQRPEYRQLARRAALESAVLLKNNGVLPLKKTGQKIALIGPMAESVELVGNWGALARDAECVSLRDGFLRKVGRKNLLVAKGCDYRDDDRSCFAEAIKTARRADVIVFAMGEHQHMSGEARSRAYLDIPGVQNALMAEIHRLGKPCVLINFSGRPLELKWHHDNLDAILQAWFPGNESGNALADLVFGDANPSGKLTMSFPVTVGQVPVYYNQYKTGRPAADGGPATSFRSCYMDVPNAPLYPFGHGLSYTSFRYDNLTLSSRAIKGGRRMTVSVRLTNTGKAAGVEVAQLYIECKCFSVTRPLKELKGFQRVALSPGKRKTLKFTLGRKELAFYNSEMILTPENTDYTLYVGGSSSGELLHAEFGYHE